MFLWRSLLKSPTFALASIFSLAIAIGANTAVFSAANALILRPLPYADADRIAIVWQRSPGLNVPQDWLSTGQYLDIAVDNTVFETSAAAIGASFNLTGAGDPERIDGIRATSSFFPLFGVRPLLGRVFDANDDVPGRAPSAVLTFGLWTRRFGQKREVLGTTLLLNGSPVTIVGVLRPDFVFGKEVMPAVNGIQRTDVILPLPLPPTARANRGGEDFNVFVKLKKKVPLARAQAEMNIFAARMRERYPEFYPQGGGLALSIVPLLDQVVGDTRSILYILLGAVAIVLLVACGNVANLTLSRAAGREKTLAVRAALGADRSDILRAALAEGFLLSFAGAVLGVILARIGIAALQAFGPAEIPRVGGMRIDVRVLLFTTIVAILAPLAFALVPGLRASRVDPASVLKEGGRAGIGGASLGLRHGRLPRLLIVTEIALSIVLLAGAGLLIRSYRHIAEASPGFDPRNVLSFRVTLPAQKYKGPEPVANFYRELSSRIHTLPGVRAVGFNYQLPLSSVALAWEPVSIEGFVPKGPGDDRIIASSAYVSPEYFAAMGIPLAHGRVFSDQDKIGAPPVVVIDDKFAARFWPNEGALGKRIRQGADGPWRTVVGIVSNTSDYQTSAQPPITAYFPVEQYGIGSRFVVVKTAPNVEQRSLFAAINREIRQLDATLPLYDVRGMSDRLSDSLARRRLAMDLLTAFASFAILLAAIGMYSVIAYWVEQRHRDIGIRMALGADRRRIVELLAREFGPMIAGGIALGVIAANALSRLLSAMLFRVSPNDMLTFAILPLATVVVAIIATVVPTRRATGVEPGIALRAD